VPNPPEGTIDLPIGRHKTDRKKMAIISEGRNAVSHYKILTDFGHFSLLEVKIETGRTHQIRVHLEAIHHPVLGDNVYNSLKRTLASCPVNEQRALRQFLAKNVHRQMLHSWKLKFQHPILKKEINIVSELPQDMIKLKDLYHGHKARYRIHGARY
jgi:23S rRNA pseudouridine1911/1915/1917 synthase